MSVDEALAVDSLAPSEAQAAAVNHGDGPCLVLAAPGSGKTTVILQRFARLVRAGVRPDEIVVHTFNRRNAEELVDRAAADLGPFPGEPPLSTYHAWAANVVRRFGWLVGIPDTVRIVDAAEQYLVLADVLRDLRPVGLYSPARPYDAVRRVLKVVQQAKQELVSPERYQAWAEAKAATDGIAFRQHQDLAAVYAQLQERYREAGVIDHDDCITVAADLLAVPAIRDAYAAVRYVMVDEYQDTNTAQAVMVERLVGERGNLMVVADDDQAIYRFRGASRENIQRFRTRFPQRTELVLPENRRSTPQIVAAAAAVIQTSLDHEAKPLLAVRPAGDRIRIVAAASAREEAQEVVEGVRERVAQGVDVSDIAVLARSRADLDAVARALRDAGIPYATHGGSDFFRAPECKAVLALLEAIADPDECQAVLTCLRLPAWSMSAPGREALRVAMISSDVPLIRMLERAVVAELTSEDAAIGARAAAAIQDFHDRSLSLQPCDLLPLVVEAAGLLGPEGSPSRDVARQQYAANLSRFCEMLETFAQARPEGKLAAALEYLMLMREAGAEGSAPLDACVDAVRLSTIHGAKGLEWPHVFVVGLVEGHLPARERQHPLELPAELTDRVQLASDSHLEEERRLFYVAMTRARDSLTLIWPIRVPGAWRDEQRSQFLDAIDKETVVASHRAATSSAPHRALPMAGVEHSPALSATTLAAFDDCPRRYYNRVVLGLPETTSLDAAFGTAVHSVLQHLARFRAQKKAVSRHVVERLWETAAADLPQRPGVEHLNAAGLDMLLGYVRTDLWKKAKILHAEHQFNFESDWGTVFTGRFDRVDEVAGQMVVVDYKTGTPRANPSSLRYDTEIRLYAVAAAQLWGLHQVTVEIHWLQGPTVHQVVFNAEDLESVGRKLWVLSHEIEKAHREAFFPMRPSGFACGRCPYRLLCPEQTTD